MSVDVFAALAGVVSATVAFFSRENPGDVASVAVGFASGSSAFLLVVTAISVFYPDHKLFDSLMNSNKVLLFGALGYAAFVNVRTIPGMLTLFRRTTGQKSPP